MDVGMMSLLLGQLSHLDTKVHRGPEVGKRELALDPLHPAHLGHFPSRHLREKTGNLALGQGRYAAAARDTALLRETSHGSPQPFSRRNWLMRVTNDRHSSVPSC